MNARFSLTDEAIRAALTPAPQVAAPSDLGASIRATMDVTPQRRRWLSGIFPTPASESIRVLVLVGLVVLLLLVGILVAVGSRQRVLATLPSDEAMFRGGPGRTGLVIGPGPIGQPRVIWEQSVGGAITANMPAVVAGVVYVADAGGGVTAFDAATGARRWEVPLGSAANTSPAVGGGVVVVGDAAGDVVALDIRDGGRRWAFRTGGEVRSSAAILEGVVYVGSADGNLYAIDLASGAERWRFAVGGAISRSPAIDAGVVYVGAAEGIFSAVDATTGIRRWQKVLGPGQIASPAVADGLVVAASGLDDAAIVHILFALDAASGAERWRFSAPSGEQLIIGSLGEGSVFAPSDDGNVYALDRDTGKPRWQFGDHGVLGAGSALAAGVLYVAGGDRAVYAVDVLSGGQLWQLAVTGQPGAIAVVGGRLYVGTDLGSVVAIGTAP
jgi:outer membrane protein assembly factor BamB